MSSKRFDLNNPTDIIEIHKLLFDEDESLMNFNAVTPETSANNLEQSVYDLDESTDASEQIEEREDSNLEQDDVESESDSDLEDNAEFYVCNRRKGKKVIESFSWKKTPYTNRKKIILTTCW